MRSIYVLIPLLSCQVFSGCGQPNVAAPNNKTLNPATIESIAPDGNQFINPDGMTIKSRILLPEGFKRPTYKVEEFGKFLENLPLYPITQEVHYYNGKIKPRNNIYNSVVKLDIGKRDLHQCADAVMRLRADYLYQQKRYKDIKFNFLSDSKPRAYTNYAKGDYSYPTYWKYLEYVFAYANTASLHDELPSVKTTQEVKIGDTFIQKGSPIGHAIIVVDLAKDSTGKTIVLLAQSYMPAQEIQILNNWNNSTLSPWYDIDQDIIKTPEWTFYPRNLKTWE
ncbi:hypothetical protein D3C81_876410 [compost metagenome]|uniref:DUF4846 domain-containing protein n=1 Tax=Sphingobacterium paramultivorum TaxID=2886510 RepID=A0A7G5DYF0_9SPHI|nr:DUF4846 domain-containing protein [Sphingobacterium paramultivorum]QMV66775.1 hypothetical protein HS960_03510 [Sphingobacterium paramultivorum]WSO15601.1 DUF4846 domain-containing protein [Sphingobacterium paramultivorum]